AGELLDGERVGPVAVHRRQVVDAIGVGDESLPLHLLGDLFDRSMQVADVGLALVNDLAVRLENETDDAMGRRVLRTHVESDLFGAQGGLCHRGDSRGAKPPWAASRPARAALSARVGKAKPGVWGRSPHTRTFMSGSNPRRAACRAGFRAT